MLVGNVTRDMFDLIIPFSASGEDFNIRFRLGDMNEIIEIQSVINDHFGSECRSYFLTIGKNSVVANQKPITTVVRIINIIGLSVHLQETVKSGRKDDNGGNRCRAIRNSPCQGGFLVGIHLHQFDDLHLLARHIITEMPYSFDIHMHAFPENVVVDERIFVKLALVHQIMRNN